MRISYHRDTDSLTLFLSDRPVDVSEEVANDTVAHYDKEGNLAAVEIYHQASERSDMSRLDLLGFVGAVRHLKHPQRRTR